MRLRKFIKNKFGISNQLNVLAVAGTIVVITMFAAVSIQNSDSSSVADQGFNNCDAQVEKIIKPFINSEGAARTVEGSDWGEVPEQVYDPGLLVDDEDFIIENADSTSQPDQIEDDGNFDDLSVISLEYTVISSSGSSGTVIEGVTGSSEIEGATKESEEEEEQSDSSLSCGDKISVTATIEDLLAGNSENQGFDYKIILWPYYETDGDGKVSGLGDDGSDDYEQVIEEDSYSLSVSSSITITSSDIVLPEVEICHIKFMITEIHGDVEDYDPTNNNKIIDFDLNTGVNHAPDIIRIDGLDNTIIGLESYYIVQVMEPDDDPVWITIDWGDGSVVEEYGPLMTLYELVDSYGYSGSDSSSGSGSVGQSGSGNIGDSEGKSGLGLNPDHDFVQNMLDLYGMYYFAIVSHSYEDNNLYTMTVHAEDDKGASDTMDKDISVQITGFSICVAQHPVEDDNTIHYNTAMAHYIFYKNDEGDWVPMGDPNYDYYWYDGYGGFIGSTLSTDSSTDSSSSSNGVSSLKYYYDSGAFGPYTTNVVALQRLFPKIIDPYNSLGLTGLLTGSQVSQMLQGSQQGASGQSQTSGQSGSTNMDTFNFGDGEMPSDSQELGGNLIMDI